MLFVLETTRDNSGLVGFSLAETSCNSFPSKNTPINFHRKNKRMEFGKRGYEFRFVHIFNDLRKISNFVKSTEFEGNFIEIMFILHTEKRDKSSFE